MLQSNYQRLLLDQGIYTLVYVGFGMKKPLGFNPNGANPAQALADEIGFPHAMAAGLDHDELRHIFHLASMSAVNMSMGTAVPSALFS